MSLRRFSSILTLLAAAAMLLCAAGCRRPSSHGATATQDDTLSQAATVYVNSGATAPALPIYALAADDSSSAQFRLEIKRWDSPVLLNSLLLSGNGDFWLASVDAIARARAHGAPVQLLAVTGWRKFHLLSSRPGDSFPGDFAGRTLPYAPPGSPGKDLLAEHLERTGQPQPAWLPQENRQLMLKLLDGHFDCALLPEPLATVLETRAPQFHRLFAEEEYLAKENGTEARLPWAALAVNCNFAQAHPQTVAVLAKAVVAEAARLAALPPEQSAALLPASIGLSPEALAKSLSHDLILALPAHELRDDIRDFLARTAPDLPWDDQLCWSAPAASQPKE